MHQKAETKAAPKEKKAKVRYSNKTKVLLCYLLAWGLALLLPVAGLTLLFPYKLVGTAPGILLNLSTALPGISHLVAEPIQQATFTAGMNAQQLAAVLATRDAEWCLFLGALNATLWLCSLLAQLGWRSVYRHPFNAAHTARRAIRSYRFTGLAILALNALGAMAVYALGLQFVSGKTVWDWLLSMNGFALNVLAAFLTFRLAAPPSLSGKHSFFKRL